jgi:hypothetical protein
MGPAVEAMAQRFVENGRRRRSPDPLQRAMQHEIDRLELEYERRIIYGEVRPPAPA